MSQINEILDNIKLPQIMKVKQVFDDTKLDNVEDNLNQKLIQKNIKSKIKPGMKIAITGGSRGISNYKELMKTVVSFVKDCGAIPFIVPAMGSHGGGTAEGQKNMLKKLGITKESVGCEIISSMDVVEVGRTSKNLPVYIDKNAVSADGIILLNRVKLHTSFRGKYESGLIKMMAIGLAKRKGADMTHSLRYENMAENLVDVGMVGLNNLNIICGVATIENGYNEVADVFVLQKDEILEEEPKILERSKHLMPRIYLDDIDVLIVNEIGKNISGTGVDTNIVGRFHTNAASGGPNTIKLGFLDISEKSGGNGNGMGLADFVSKKFYDKVDFEATYINAITSTEPNSVKLPLVLDDDKYVFKGCVKLCGVRNLEDLKLVIINNTKELDEVYMSKAAFENVVDKSKVKKISDLFDIPFDKYNNLNLF
ncbi:lactate racemase domain-containing protein [Intestinibacter sp.]|uniref:lactate racemase domain-containing protein n=1 Tax=Intestinibacter sp. TaxID=1965304 RepID=UPI002A908991|nr:lactate racemase domain-containing protein [Intestinibacter sp.]MDY5211003.1 lactate racemase domain-containing protein [Intestinibacter sp.]